MQDIPSYNGSSSNGYSCNGDCAEIPELREF